MSSVSTMTVGVGTVTLPDGTVLPVHDLTLIEEVDHQRVVGTERNPNWTATDDHGHVHRYGPDGGTPTLYADVSDPFYCELCNDVHDLTVMRCRECHAEVRPGTHQVSKTFQTGRTFMAAFATTAAFPLGGNVVVTLRADGLQPMTATAEVRTLETRRGVTVEARLHGPPQPST